MASASEDGNVEGPRVRLSLHHDSLLIIRMCLDNTRFAGDDTISGYSGILREFLMNIQLYLRLTIATEDAFPKSSDFERSIQALFESKAQEAFDKKRKKQGFNTKIHVTSLMIILQF